MDARRTSKRLSYVLRHAPGSVGLALEAGGWVPVEALLAALAAHGTPLRRGELERLVATNDKQRFAFDPTGTRIRASQGHSLPVELGYRPRVPPDVLFHGTSSQALPLIREQGLRPGRRHAVHLSPDQATARRVGQRHRRHGAAVVLRVDAAGLAASGRVFTCSANGVWLVDAVPASYLSEL